MTQLWSFNYSQSVARFEIFSIVLIALFTAALMKQFDALTSKMPHTLANDSPVHGSRPWNWDQEESGAFLCQTFKVGSETNEPLLLNLTRKLSNRTGNARVLASHALNADSLEVPFVFQLVGSRCL